MIYRVLLRTLSPYVGYGKGRKHFLLTSHVSCVCVQAGILPFVAFIPCHAFQVCTQYILAQTLIITMRRAMVHNVASLWNIPNVRRMTCTVMIVIKCVSRNLIVKWFGRGCSLLWHRMMVHMAVYIQWCLSFSGWIADSAIILLIYCWLLLTKFT